MSPRLQVSEGKSVGSKERSVTTGAPAESIRKCSTWTNGSSTGLMPALQRWRIFARGYRRVVWEWASRMAKPPRSTAEAHTQARCTPRSSHSM